jgi:hypothetical protein
MSDPAIGRFWQIDPLAEDYVYNSTYAFQENKMGMGVELEGAELWERFKAGIDQLKQGASNLLNNETGKELNRRIESGKTDNAARKEEIQQERLAGRSEAMGDIAEGTSEAAKGGTQAVGTTLENTGDIITVAGIATAQPEIIALGETISGAGTTMNTAVDVLDGKPLKDIVIDNVPGVVFGQLGKTAVKATKKAAGAASVAKGETKVSEAILKANEKTFEGITTELIIPAIEDKYDNND